MPNRLKYFEIEIVLRKFGFVLVSQKGSHRKWRSYQTNKQVIVPIHKGKDLPIGTLKSIISGSGLKNSDFGL
ncbi:MAG: type II toxin-antitoxin system HicA family toxin [Candidatus Cloacimonetes bacterium]|nr:type II toxin-antitoxin system HicA family toxin [Candidatus Cloacimonadota bacterium]